MALVDLEKSGAGERRLPDVRPRSPDAIRPLLGGGGRRGVPTAAMAAHPRPGSGNGPGPEPGRRIAFEMQFDYSDCMTTKTIGFAVADEDLARLERLTRKYGGGNRSAFLREAMRQMEVLERAERLSELQAYGVERSAAGGVSHDEAVTVVRRVLKGR